MSVIDVNNLMFARLNVTEFMRRSKLRKAFFDVVQISPFKQIQSDLLRLAILYKHGGSYFDTDTITFKGIPEGLPNFCQSGKVIVACDTYKFFLACYSDDCYVCKQTHSLQVGNLQLARSSSMASFTSRKGIQY